MNSNQSVEESSSSNPTHNKSFRYGIGLVMILISLLMPAAVMIYYGSEGWQLMAMTWWVSFWGENPLIVILELHVLLVSTFLFTLRPIFVFQIIRYYNGKTTKKNTFVIGLMSELQVIIIAGFVWVTTVITSPYPPGVVLSFYIPIPILFFMGYMLMEYIPAPDITRTWKTLENQKKWWNVDSIE